MKAVVMFQGGERPQYTEDFSEPTVKGEDQLLITMKAAAIKQLDRSIAAGKHYTSGEASGHARVVGGDGVGILADGTRVFAIGERGMVAEKAIIDRRNMVKLPEGIDDAVAAALPNAIAGSAMALRFRAGMAPGETVLINGATGFTGNIAVQVAKHYGAKRIIVTGRNERTLQSLLDVGADEIVALKQEDKSLIAQLKEIHKRTPIDIVIDYLWGHPAELILEVLKGDGGFTHKTRFVTAGSLAGDAVQLSAAILRSVDLTICGSGLGSWKKEEMQKLFVEIMPEMFQLAVEGKLKVETVSVQMKEIGEIWDRGIGDGKRLVVRM